MTLKETLKSDLTEAIRSSNKVVSGTIRMVLTAITNEEVSGKEARVLTDDEIITVLSLAGGIVGLASGRFSLGQVAIPVGVGVGAGTGVPIVTAAVTATV